MNIKVEIWDVNKLIHLKDDIDPKPQYQRTSVWNPSKKKLLIDSILRGYDIPKFYIREVDNDPIYSYEVTDGQQRMRAIWEFSEDNFKLDGGLIGMLNTAGLTYSELRNDLPNFNCFGDFKVQVAIIENADPEEIRMLFARLQMGERLNAVELRHALVSNIGNAIWSIVETNTFFKESKIKNNRYKHQDFLDHAVTLCYYDAQRNLRSADIKFLYQDMATTMLDEMQPLLRNIARVLDIIREINSFKKGIFQNKTAFVDVFYFIYQNLSDIQEVKAQNFSNSFFAFETSRKKYNKAPEKLIESPASPNYDKELYEYIQAFKIAGSNKDNAKIRYRVLYNKLLNTNNFIFN